MPGVTRRIEEYYRDLIGGIQPGDRLPSERSVVRLHETCRSTIRIVMVKLVTEKLVYSVHGKGYFKA